MGVCLLFLALGTPLLLALGHIRPISASCAQPAAVEHAVLHGQKDGSEYRAGDKLTMQCRPGYILDDSDDYQYDYDYNVITVDSMTITCLEGNTWTGTFPRCTVFTCVAPKRPFHGSINYTHDLQTVYHEADRVHFHCEQGFDLIGARSSVCSSASYGWRTPPPKCTRPVCPSLVQLENGRIVGRSYEVGATLTFHCSDGYSLSGSAERTCLGQRRWSGQLTVCDNGASDCGNPGIPDGGAKQGMRYNMGNVVKYRCEDGFTMFGKATRECLRNRRWSGEEVTCEAPYAYDSAVDVGQRWRSTADILAQETETSVVILRKVRGETERLARTTRMEQQPTVRRRPSHISALSRRMSRAFLHGAPSRLRKTASRTSSRPTRAPISLYSGGLDVYFLFDASGSIEQADFEKEIDFAATLIQEWGVSDSEYGTKVGALFFNSSAHIIFHTSEVTSTEQAIRELRRNAIPVGGGTDIGSALRTVHEVMVTQTLATFPDRQSKTVVIVITDGLSNMGGSPAYWAKRLREVSDIYSTEIFCIGITRETSREQLKVVASEPHAAHVFVTDQPNEFKEIIAKMRMDNIDYSPCGRAGDTDLSSYVKAVGGAYAKKGAWPWMTGIYLGSAGVRSTAEKLQRYRLFCGGTLIDPQWVLTAAHCTYRYKDGRKVRITTQELLTVVGTTQNPSATEHSADRLIKLPVSATPREVVEIHRHPGFIFDNLNLDHDIALLKLASPVVLSPDIRLACRPTDNNKEDLYAEKKYGVVTGWGHPDPATRYELGLAVTTKHLRQIEIAVQTAATCRRSLTSHNYTHRFTDNMFCAGDTSNADLRQDSCRGDSGGPFVVPVKDRLTNQITWILSGIVSWGIGCALENHYGFYTRVDRYLDWINNIITTENMP